MEKGSPKSLHLFPISTALNILFLKKNRHPPSPVHSLGRSGSVSCSDQGHVSCTWLCPNMLNTMPGSSKPFQRCRNTALTVSLILGLLCFCNSKAQSYQGPEIPTVARELCFRSCISYPFLSISRTGPDGSSYRDAAGCMRMAAPSQTNQPLHDGGKAWLPPPLRSDPSHVLTPVTQPKWKCAALCCPGGNWQLGKNTLTYRHSSVLQILNA